jgi:hypothetical protein
MVHSTGAVTQLAASALPIHAVAQQATVVAIAGSGIVNPQPGIDVVRFDGGDRPFVYNVDHYSVVEDLPSHPEYEAIVRKAGVQLTREVRKFMSENVFVVGPERLDNHWVMEIPAQIAAAKPPMESPAPIPESRSKTQKPSEG